MRFDEEKPAQFSSNCYQWGSYVIDYQWYDSTKATSSFSLIMSMLTVDYFSFVRIQHLKKGFTPYHLEKQLKR